MLFRIALLLTTAFAGTRADPPGPYCLDAWSMYEGFCFWSTHFAAKYDLAGDICSLASYHSSPASVHSTLQNAGLNEQLSGTPAWIGLRRGQDGTFRWSDGSTSYSFTYWDSDQPGSGDCVLMNVNNVTGQWGTADCAQEHVITCRERATICPDKWTLFGRTCYRFVGRSVEASSLDEECAALHSWKPEPVSIHSDDENDFLGTLSKGTGSVWIGLSRASANESFRWADGSSLDYEHWDYRSRADQYVYMDYDGTWEFAGSSIQHPFFCQIRIDRV